MKKFLALLLAFVTAFSITSCGGNNKNKVLATVGEQKIIYADYLKEFAIYKYQIEQIYGKKMWDQMIPNENKTMLESAKQSLLEKVIEDKAVLAQSEKESITADEAKLKQMTDYALKSLNNDKSRKAFYDANGIDEEFLTKTIKNSLIIESYRNKKMESIQVTDKEVNDYYEKNKTKYPQEKIRASHILISTLDKSGNPLPEEEVKKAEKKINYIYGELKAGGDFAQLAKKNSDDSSAANGGDLGFFTKGMMVKEFEDAAFALNVGEISKPVKTQFGYHIIKLTEKESPEKLKKEMLDMAKNDLKTEKYYNEVEKLVKENESNINESLLKNLENDIVYPAENDKGDKTHESSSEKNKPDKNTEGNKAKN